MEEYKQSIFAIRRNPNALQTARTRRDMSERWGPNPLKPPTFARLTRKLNNHLEYVGDFNKGSVGYRYVKAYYEKDPKRYLEESERGERYRERINTRATTLENDPNGEKKVAKLERTMSIGKTMFSSNSFSSASQNNAKTATMGNATP